MKIIILASVSDGEIQPSELEMMNHLKSLHPVLKKISENDVQEATADIYNKLTAGMEAKHIIEQLGSSMTQNQKNTAYALAKEVCSADYQILPAETEFLSELEIQFKIPKKLKDALELSIKTRYIID